MLIFLRVIPTLNYRTSNILIIQMTNHKYHYVAVNWEFLFIVLQLSVTFKINFQEKKKKWGLIPVKTLYGSFSSLKESIITWDSSKLNFKVERNASYEIHARVNLTYSDTVRKMKIFNVFSSYVLGQNLPELCSYFIMLIQTRVRVGVLCFSVCSSDIMLQHLCILKQGWACGHEQVR